MQRIFDHPLLHPMTMAASLPWFPPYLPHPMKQLVPILLAVAFASSPLVRANALEDLASPDPKVRDQAAEVQRATYKSIPESKWQPLKEQLKEELTEHKLQELLAPYNPTRGGCAAGGGSYSRSFRLDAEWCLVCWFSNNDNKMFSWKIFQSMERVRVQVPKDYTGRWPTYFANGKLSDEGNYKDGKATGTYILYHEDGSKAYVENYADNGVDSEQIGYHPSGKVSYRVRFKNGRQDGPRTSYDEVGNVTSVREP